MQLIQFGEFCTRQEKTCAGVSSKQLASSLEGLTNVSTKNQGHHRFSHFATCAYVALDSSYASRTHSVASLCSRKGEK